MRDESLQPWMPFFLHIDCRIKFFALLSLAYGVYFFIAYYAFPPITITEYTSISANSIPVALFSSLITYIFFITYHQITEIKFFIAKPADFPQPSEKFKILTVIETSVFLLLSVIPFFSLNIIFKNLPESLLILILLYGYLIILSLRIEKLAKENQIRKKIS